MMRSKTAVVKRILTASRRPATLGLTPAGAVSLSMGEPDADTAVPIVDAAIEAMRTGRTHYAPLSGEPLLREELAAWFARRTGRPTAAEETVLTHGASAGLAALTLALVNAGDVVLTPEPTYSLYTDHLAMVGAENVWVPNRPDQRLDLDRIAELAPTARVLVLCNPSNPTGQVLTGAELRTIGDILEANPDLILVSDEAYSEIVFDGEAFVSAATLESVRERVVIVGTFSKAFAMTGWRLGYVVAAPDVASSIDLVHRTVNGALNTFVQDAAREALRTPEAVLRAAADSYEHRRDIVMKHLSAISGVSVARPSGAFYAFPRIDAAHTSQELVERFAAGGVIVRAGSEYGPSGEGHVRISFATDEETLIDGLRRFARVVQEIHEEENKEHER
ncbi:pyridoxal phosphate-dependent aminotransferase [Dactylosporangium sp. CA-233914]|uniref:pyridoxal phosphate-dependent aminotransferase n=1 Tax=Dactylosporangium sp. CA-233914 TaxID=3239934 RepID=UPI003D9428C5